MSRQSSRSLHGRQIHSHALENSELSAKENDPRSFAVAREHSVPSVSLPGLFCSSGVSVDTLKGTSKVLDLRERGRAR